ncbi:MAG: GtrA family protein [Geobacteraceae bacterium]|nr:GtrA family protein [Geobacteraceae bacterium]
MISTVQQLTMPIINRIYRRRFLKFCTIGASGVLVNMAVLYLGREYLFTAIPWPHISLNLSLAFAVLCATISNFAGNRHWTWRDRRKDHMGKAIPLQFGQYALACWLGIALQFIFTNVLAIYFYYLVANLMSIVLASIFNYLVNDRWTFCKRAKEQVE